MAVAACDEGVRVGWCPRLVPLSSLLHADLGESQAQVGKSVPDPLSKSWAKPSTYLPSQTGSLLNATSNSNGALIGLSNPFVSMMLFPGHAASTKHSIARKLASFEGLSLPALMVYDFVVNRERRCVMRGRQPATPRFRRGCQRRLRLLHVGGLRTDAWRRFVFVESRAVMQETRL
jgi:hypothetical protein